MAENLDWPVKKRELHNHHFDSTVWNDLQFRDDDIVVATYAIPFAFLAFDLQRFGLDPTIRLPRIAAPSL